jgi:thiamine biosynthesis protein ThiS
MDIILNGQAKSIPGGLTVEGLLQHLEITPGRVAVEINEEIVRKTTYGEVLVRERDRVEVVQFMGGGALSFRIADCGLRNQP